MRACRRGRTQREAARQTGLSQAAVARWVKRAAGKRLDRVDWEGLSHRPGRLTRTSGEVEQTVLDVREWLREQSDLGEYGPSAILRELQRRGLSPCPARATIARILKRRDAIKDTRRLRRPPPPRVWYLPEVARGETELDSFDYIDDLYLLHGARFAMLTAVSSHGGLPAAFLHDPRSAVNAMKSLLNHWRRYGRPEYAQFDNDIVFQGPRQHPDAFGRVIRLCLSLGVVPVFAPPYEHGPQNLIEGFNSQWKNKVWRRRIYTSRADLREASARYIAAVIESRAKRIASAPSRRPIPSEWSLELGAPLRGRVIFLRRLDEDGAAQLLGHRFAVSQRWGTRLVRAEVAIDAERIHFYALNRNAPSHQPRLRTVRHRLPQRRFRE